MIQVLKNEFNEKISQVENLKVEVHRICDPPVKVYFKNDVEYGKIILNHDAPCKYLLHDEINLYINFGDDTRKWPSIAG